MKRVIDLRLLFTIVAIVEAIYALVAFTPPSLVAPATGWALSPDGHWVTKILGVALGSQALVAWILRRAPHLGVAWALALYQLGSATVDWVMWLVLADQGIFSTSAARAGVMVAIPTHYALGLLLILGIRAARKEAAPCAS
jgi:hypothetical protein